MDLDGGGGAAALVADGMDGGMGGCPFALPGGGGGGPCLDGGLGDPAGGILGNGLDPEPGGGGRGRELSDPDGLFDIGGGIGRGLELPLGGWGREVLEFFGDGGLKLGGGFIAEPLGPSKAEKQQQAQLELHCILYFL